MEDHRIVELFKEGKHEKAFLGLYRQFPAVLKMIRSNNGTKDDALDVFQEALIVLYHKLKEENFVLTSALGTYVFSVSRFIWLNEIRKRKKQEGEMPEDDIPDKDEIEELLAKEGKYRKAEELIMQLGEKCRELLVLFYHKKLSMKVIADRLGFSSDKIAKNQKYKCLERARALRLRSGPNTGDL
jgi:RNA polymerase sigma factor (sigma-70 family)